MKRRILVFIGLLCAGSAGAQRTSDTAAVIKELDAVMGFAVQPYVHYTSVMAMLTGPMLPPGDTGRIVHADFYKYKDDLCYRSEAQEVYLQDSLMVQVDHQHKVIQIGRVDVATKKNMDLLPLKRKDRDRLLRNRYTITKLPDQGDTSAIVLKSQTGGTRENPIGTEVMMQYTKSGHLPLLMRLTVRQREPASAAMSAVLRTNGFDVQRMTEEAGGVRSLVMTQVASMRFGEVELTEEKAMGMPLWKERLSYDAASGEYRGKGSCSGYQIIKTF
jgi:hypothetical protein